MEMRKMKAVYLHKGDEIDHTPNTDVDAGDVVVVGANLLGIAKLDIKSGTLGALSLKGVFDVAKTAGAGKAIANGVEVYWDAANKVATTDSNSGANLSLGKTVTATADSDTTVRVRVRQ
jgi:predicted RecA/RadA family phage recombinase